LVFAAGAAFVALVNRTTEALLVLAGTAKGPDFMTHDYARMRLRIRELEGRIHARRQLAGKAPDRAWHLDYAEAYEAEVRQLQARIQSMETSSRNPGSFQQETG
jgi:hypothetical protein